MRTTMSFSDRSLSRAKHHRDASSRAPTSPALRRIWYARMYLGKRVG
jgi:hypothetical protein